MKQPDNRNTTRREEMMCPRCDHEGLEPNPAYDDEYSGKSEIIKATRCPNTDCDYHYGLPDKEVIRQMPEDSILPDFDLNKGNIIKGSIIIIGLIFVILQLGLFSLGGETNTNTVESDIHGQLSGDEFESINDINAELISDSGDVVSEQSINDGNFTFENINEGSYMIYVYSEELDYSPDGKQIEITDDSNYDDLKINYTESESIDINQTVNNASIDINYNNPHNINDLDLSLSSIEGDNIQRQHEFSSDRDRTILVPVTPSSEQIRVEGLINTEEQTINNQYTGDETEYDIYGNKDAENLQLELTDESSSDVQEETFEITGDTTETVSVASEETMGNVNMTIRNGTAQASEQETGVWDGQENITFFTGVDSFTTANMQIQPEQVTDDKQISGEIDSNEISASFEGNQPVDDAVIRFEGGDADSTVIESVNEQDDARNGTITKEMPLIEIEEDSRYRLDWDASVIENEDLVDFAYEINGDETEITEGSDGTGISLNEGDEINFILELERDTVSDDSNTPHFGSIDDDLEVEEMNFSDDNPEPGDTIEKFATISNNANHDITEEFVFYLNGDDVASREYTIPSNSEKEIGGISELGTTSISEEGTNVWFLNDRGPFFLEVGESEPTYGAGELSGEIRNIGEEGEVSVDTNSDGELDCTALANDGECSFDELSTGDNIINVSETNVGSTSYTIEYTERTNPRDITVDIGEDNITDFEHNGVLTGTERENVEISPGNTTMAINSENNVPVQYSLSWDSDSIIDNPVVYVNGENVVRDEGTFQEPKHFELEPLPQGDNEFRFRANDGGYTVDVEWVEDEGQSYPDTLINNRDVCSQGSEFAIEQTCDITSEGMSPGSHTLDFDGISDSFNYQLRYYARAVSGSISVNINDETERFSRDSASPEEWDDVRSTSLLERGENEISIDTSTENNLDTYDEGIIEYSIDTGAAENPQIQVTNGDGETNTVDIPDSALDDSNLLVEDTDITIPQEWLTVGENNIEIKTDDGVFEIYGSIITTEESISFESQ